MKGKRFLATISFSALISLYVTLKMPKNIFNVSLALFALFILIHRFTSNKFTKEMIVSFVSIVLAAVYLNAYNWNLMTKINSYNNVADTVRTGVIKEVRGEGAGRNYVVRLDDINNENIRNFSVIVYTPEDFEKGDTIEMIGKYRNFSPKSNFLYNYSKSIFGYFNAYKIHTTEGKANINHIFNDLRRLLTHKNEEWYAPESLSIANAMGLGDKSGLDDETVKAFRVTGISHALVVSGLHVGFVTLAVSLMLGIIPIKKKIKNIITCIFLIVFMGIIGFTPSVIRAGVLAIAFLLGRNFIVEIDNYTILGIIIFFTLLINPYSAVNASLLLSYCAYFGVMYAVQICVERKYGKIKSSLLVSTMAVLFTSPVMSMMNMDVTLLSPIFNLICAPIIMVICTLSFFIPIFMYVPIVNLIARFILLPINKIAIYTLLFFTEFVKENFSFAVIDINNEIMRFSIWIIAVLCVIASVRFTKKRMGEIFIVAVYLISFLCYHNLNNGVIEVKVFDGSKEPSYAISYNDENYLILSENINEKKLSYFIKKYEKDNFKQIIYCGEEEPEFTTLRKYSEDIVLLNTNKSLKNDIFSINSTIAKDEMIYIINMDNVIFGFSHNKSNLDNNPFDFYFLGSDTPENIDSENSYYFYPAIKSNKEIIDKYKIQQLYDVLTIKIKNGKYYILKDVKNFGNQLQNYG